MDPGRVRGERQRDRVLTDAEWQQYIVECPQPWRDAAIIIRSTGMRSGDFSVCVGKISISMGRVG